MAERGIDVVIAGAHGQIGRRLGRRLIEGGDYVRGLIRNPDHEQDLRSDGVQAVLCDLERADVDDVAALIAHADAVVFAAGAGPGSGAARKWTVDRDAAVKLLLAAQNARVQRYVMVSSVGAESPPDGDDVFSVYLRAKAEADRALAASDLDWTIVRPGRLTDDPGSGTVSLTVEPERGEVSRDDVAAVLEALLHAPGTAGLTLYCNGGDEPIDEAVASRSSS
jgi:uncharacterized protein YbjT (DUF2867 family)